MIESRLDQNFALKIFLHAIKSRVSQKRRRKKNELIEKTNNAKIIFDSTTIAEHETKRCYRRYGRDEYKFRRLLLLFSRSTSIFSPLPGAPNVAVRNDVYLSARRRRCTIER